MAKSQRKKDCGCKSKKAQMNKEFNYRLKPRCFTESEYKQYTEFKTDLELKDIGKQDNIDYIHSLYNSIMNTNVSKPKLNSSIKPLIDMMDKLDIVYSYYKK